MIGSGAPRQSIDIALFALANGGVGAALDCSDESGRVELIGGGNKLLVGNPGAVTGFFVLGGSTVVAPPPDGPIVGMMAPPGVSAFEIGNDVAYTHAAGICEAGLETRLIFYRGKGGM